MGREIESRQGGSFKKEVLTLWGRGAVVTVSAHGSNPSSSSANIIDGVV
jgi:hypothetical protein